MSALLKRKRFTTHEYLLLEEIAEYRSQFYFGEIFAMAGASRRHNIIAGNCYASLHSQLRRRPCEIYQNDMRVKGGEDFYTYPDVVVVCGEPQIEKDKGETLLNPTVLIEVLSNSTAKFDRNEKAELYRAMPSVQEYVIVWQDRTRIEKYVRQTNNSWLFNEYSTAENAVRLESINCELSLADVYERVDFTEVETEE